jgi:predicted type IV restriction endonuclease
MTTLNLPQTDIKIRKHNGKDCIFDVLRQKYIRLTPEEFVRQHFINYLVNHLNYPQGRLANEVCIELGNTQKRCDTVLYDETLIPVMIIEYKAPTVEISQNVFEQIARYNMALNVPWLIVSNGLRHFCCHIDSEKSAYVFEKNIPEYERIKANAK